MNQIFKSTQFYAIKEEKVDSFLAPIRKVPVSLEVTLWEAKDLWQLNVSKRVTKEEKPKKESILL